MTMNDLSLILSDLQVIALELQKQGFEVEPDEDARGRHWMLVFCGDVLITTFTADPTRWDLRAAALHQCRRYGFIWPP